MLKENEKPMMVIPNESCKELVIIGSSLARCSKPASTSNHKYCAEHLVFQCGRSGHLLYVESKNTPIGDVYKCYVCYARLAEIVVLASYRFNSKVGYYTKL